MRQEDMLYPGEVRHDRVEAIRTALACGLYHVSAALLAEALLQKAAHEALARKLDSARKGVAHPNATHWH